MRCTNVLVTAALWTAVSMSICQAAPLWSMNASSCRANDAAIQSNWYSSNDGLDIGFRGTTATATITMYCPVLTLGQDPRTGDGSVMDLIGISGHVAEPGPTIKAQLFRVSKNTGALSNVGEPVALAFIGPGPAYRKTAQLIHQFDFTQFFYYVQVDISRTSPTQFPAFYVVDLSV
jgi:hypothetical protein